MMAMIGMCGNCCRRWRSRGVRTDRRKPGVSRHTHTFHTCKHNVLCSTLHNSSELIKDRLTHTSLKMNSSQPHTHKCCSVPHVYRTLTTLSHYVTLTLYTKNAWMSHKDERRVERERQSDFIYTPKYRTCGTSGITG